MIPRPDKTAIKTALRRDHVGVWLITSAMVGLLLLQAVAPSVSCCTVQVGHQASAFLIALSSLAAGI